MSELKYKNVTEKVVGTSMKVDAALMSATWEIGCAAFFSKSINPARFR